MLLEPHRARGSSGRTLPRTHHGAKIFQIRLVRTSAGESPQAPRAPSRVARRAARQRRASGLRRWKGLFGSEADDTGVREVPCRVHELEVVEGADEPLARESDVQFRSVMKAAAIGEAHAG